MFCFCLSDLKAAFAFFDENGDGHISFEELGLAMNKCGQHPTKLQLRLLMTECDKDSQFLQLVANDVVPLLQRTG